VKPEVIPGRAKNPSTPHEAAPRTLIDALLAEQHQLTAVETFAFHHEAHKTTGSHYRDLIPQVAPGPGQQLAFEVNLDQCSGCKACVTACHSLNGLDDGEAWREVGTLLSEDWRQPFRQTVTTACHHCADPGCLNGCPVLAYEKDPITGIVRHLDDQCIGCQYCIFKCPYDVPKYSAARGIVRKCDMCFQRLEVGEAPACAQACPNEAIRITVVSVPVSSPSPPAGERAGVRGRFNVPFSPSPAQEGTPSPADGPRGFAKKSELINNLLPASPDPAITRPTTRYVSKLPLPARLVPASDHAAVLQTPHWPLIWMLVLTQMGVGMFAFSTLAEFPARPALVWSSFAVTLLGLFASSLHLGQPTKAWRSFLNLRRSWLSREIVVFGLFLPTLAVTALLTLPRWNVPLTWTYWCGGFALLLGLAGVFCSGMVYHDTARPLWRGWRSIGRFAATTAILGLAAVWTVDAFSHRYAALPLFLLLVVSSIKFAVDHKAYRLAEADEHLQANSLPRTAAEQSLIRSAQLTQEQLGTLVRIRFATTLVGGCLLPSVALILSPATAALAVVAGFLCLSGELAERYLFFTTVVPMQMPRGN
jgi:Fe-S-cluster-containing dehydrogenase component/DMSO reductase anchor subunit